MSVLAGCVKCRDLSTKDTLSPCIHILPPNNKGMPYDLAKLGYGSCAIYGENWLSNADRKCPDYKALE